VANGFMDEDFRGWFYASGGVETHLEYACRSKHIRCP
jgi:hypothetical protein